MPAVAAKPPFQPLTMAALERVPLSKLTHVSTFSGAGGTCLGFRLAGFRTLWANDIDAHARACYRKNLTAPINGRDLRFVQAVDILKETKLLKAGELDVFEGSPPCTNFSTVGKRAKGWGQRAEHAGYVQTNIEDLFFEWLRLLDGLRPRAFVAENVAGMVKGVAKGYFKAILRQMKVLGYRTEARLVDAQWLGVPQRRLRLIFLGIRDDLEVAPVFPQPLPYRYSVRDALPWIQRMGTSIPYKNFRAVDRDPARTMVDASTQPSATIMAAGLNLGGGVVQVQARTFGDRSGWGDIVETTNDPSTMVLASAQNLIVKTGTEQRVFTIAELKRICSFPDDYVLPGSFADQWRRLGNSVPPLMAAALARELRTVLEGVDRQQRRRRK